MKPPRLIFTLIAFALCIPFVQAQVGIGTTSPEATLHVEGDLIVKTTNAGTPTRLSGLDGTGLLTDVTLGSNLTLSGGVLSSSRGDDGSTVIIDTKFEDKNNWDIGIDGGNSNVTLFIIRKNNGNNKLKIKSIAGGTEGRRIRIINDAGGDLEIEFVENGGGDAGNNIYIYTKDKKMKEWGSCELIYSTAFIVDNSSIPGYWCLVQFDKFR